MSGKFWVDGVLCILLFLACCIALPAAAAERITYVHTDVVGSPVAATDASRKVLWREHYAPYGQRLDDGDKQNVQWFTGHYQEPVTGLVYMGARWYNPEIGRFYSIDPVDLDPESIQSFNRYSYGYNNPYKFIDPDGKLPVVPFVWGAIAAYTVYDTFSMPDVPFDSGAAVSIAPEVIFAGAGAGALKVGRAGVAAEVAADVPRLARTWSAKGFDPSRLQWHFKKHSGDWGGNMPSAAAYEARAQRLLNSQPGGRIEGFTSKEGAVFRYNTQTNEFATARSDGTIETLFRPSRGAEYWKEQVGRYGP